MPKKIFYEDVKKYVESFEGHILISTEYINAIEKLQIRCPNNHIFKISYNSFKNGHRCKECSNDMLRKLKQTPIEQVYQLISSSGYTFIRWIDEYKNNTSKFLLKCNYNHEFSFCYAYLKDGLKCPYCEGKRKINIDYIRSEFLKRNYTLISTEYIDAHSSLTYICNKHNDKQQYISWNNFNNGKGCKYCGIEVVSKANLLSETEVFSKFVEKGLIIESGEKYIGTNIKIKCRCINHIDILQELSYGNILISKFSCKYCYIDAYKGENHPLWTGGNSNLHDVLRDYIKEWKDKSMEHYNFRCVVTNKYFDVIHHGYNFHKIVDEVFNELGLNKYNIVGDYSQTEIYNIKSLLLKKHYSYGFGLPLCNELHNLYHKIYGKYDNSYNQFEEFRERYHNFEFDNLLDDKYKYCNILNEVC